MRRALLGPVRMLAMTMAQRIRAPATRLAPRVTTDRKNGYSIGSSLSDPYLEPLIEGLLFCLRTTRFCRAQTQGGRPLTGRPPHTETKHTRTAT